MPHGCINCPTCRSGCSICGRCACSRGDLLDAWGQRIVVPTPPSGQVLLASDPPMWAPLEKTVVVPDENPTGEWHELNDGSLCYRVETGIALVTPATASVVVFTGTDGNYRRFQRRGTDVEHAKMLAERRLGIKEETVYDAIADDWLSD